jgi:hypothetical protein
MPRLVGFSRFAALLEEQIGEKISRRVLSGDQGMIVGWSIGAGVRVEPPQRVCPLWVSAGLDAIGCAEKWSRW